MDTNDLNKLALNLPTIDTLREQLAASQLEAQRLREALIGNMEWVRAALDCKTWDWDPQQWDAANGAYEHGTQALSLSSDLSALREYEARVLEEAASYGEDGLVRGRYDWLYKLAQQKREGK